MSPGRVPRIAQFVVLISIVAVGFVLRMTPAWVTPGGEFLGDAAYHARLTAEAAEHGTLPAVDALSDAPDGRRTALLLPVGMYNLMAAGARVWGDAGLERYLQSFTALSGALLAVAVFALARGLGLHAAYALIAALIVGILPAHLHRTFAWWVRYDALGTLLAITHMALLAWSFRSQRMAARVGLAIAAGLTLAAGASVWRLTLLFPLFEGLAVKLWFIARGPDARLRNSMTITIAAATLGLLGTEYVREQGYMLSRGWLMPMMLTALLWLPATLPRLLRLGVTIAGALTVSWLGSFRAEAYDQVGAVVGARVAALWGAVSSDPLTRLMLDVEELSSVAPWGLAGPAYLSGVALLAALGAIVLLFEARQHSTLRAALAQRERVVFLMTLVMVAVFTLLFARSKVLLAPLFAIGIAGLLQSLLSQRHAARRRAVVIAAFLIALGWTGWDAWQLMSTRTSQMHPDYRSMLETVQQSTAPGEPIAAPWELGYDIQRYATRSTLMDGLLESPLNRQRILAFATAAMQKSPDSLAAFCRRQGTRWLLVPPSTHLYGVAALTDAPFVHKLIPGVPLTPDEADRTLIRMMVFGGDQGPFLEEARAGEYRLMRLSD